MSSAPNKQSDYLPSKLTPMEKFHMIRHRSNMPNVIFAILKFEGAIDRRLFDKAFDYVVSRHEMGYATLSQSGKRWLNPHAGDQPQSLIVWHDGKFEKDKFRTKPIDIPETEGLRLEIFCTDQSTEIVAQIHHAKIDGLGALQGMREILIAYDNLFHSEPVDRNLRKLNSELFRVRHRIGLFQKGWWKRVHMQWIPVYGAIKFAMAKISHINVSFDKAKLAKPLAEFPTYLTRRIGADLYQSLRKQESTVNQILLAALFRAVDRYQKDRNEDRGNLKIRIVVPINIRERKDLRSPVCNRVSFVQLDRGDKDLANPRGLIWGINYELGIIRHFKFEKALGITFKLMSMIPGLMKWRLGKQKVNATTFLTNLSTPFRKIKLPTQDGQFSAGEMTCVDVQLVPPFYDLTPATFLFSGYADRYQLTLHYDSRVFAEAQANQLLDLFMEELAVMADLGVSPKVPE